LCGNFYIIYVAVSVFFIYFYINMENNDFEDLIHKSAWKDWTIISITGRFTVQNILQVKSSFDTLIADSEIKIGIDLNKTTYLDSSAITILLNFNRRCAEKSGKVVLFGLAPDIEAILSIVGIDKVVKTVKTIEDLTTV
jgi:anti-anti-sigma factor